ncbi:hypothetical protein [Phytoactinopolyspora halophila]|nr:hypothetical protein [Phytoactinopolyspora halophila]
MAKIIAVLVALAGPGVLGHVVAGRSGVMIGITVGAVVVLAICYAVVTRTSDAAQAAQDVGADAMVWVSAGWVIVAGWLVGDTMSTAGAIIGSLLSVLVVGVTGLAVAARLDGSLAAALRRRAGR